MALPICCVSSAVFLPCALIAPVYCEARDPTIELRRGVGVHAWMNWSEVRQRQRDEYVWPPYGDSQGRPRFGQDDVVRIKRMGFDFVCLSVDPGPLLSVTGGKRQEALRILASKIEMIVSHGLNVFLDLYPVNQVSKYGIKAINVPTDNPMARRYRSVVRDTARMIANLSHDRVALELMNELACSLETIPS